MQRAPYLDEIAEVSRVSRKEIGKTYRFISRELGLTSPTSPIDYIPRFCSGLNLKGEVQSQAVEILRQATERELTNGKGPRSVAAAAIYISTILSGERRTHAKWQKWQASPKSPSVTGIRNWGKNWVSRSFSDPVFIPITQEMLCCINEPSKRAYVYPVPLHLIEYGREQVMGL